MVRVSTAALWAFGSGLVAAGVVVGATGERAVSAVLVASGAADLALCTVFRRLQPVAYTLDGSGLTVERRGSTARRFAGLVRALPDARLGVRIAGSGGLYGYLGRFRLAGGGRVEAFVTNRAAALIVRAGDVIVAVSPADRDGFLGDVEAQHA